MKKTTILLVLATLWLNPSTKAQQASITGTITDQENRPIPGATITENQGKASAQSDQQGHFALKTAGQKGTLSISHLGYLTTTINYTAGQPLNVQLQQDQATLQNVDINAGYYRTDRRKLTGSISSVSARDIERQPVTSPLQALQGRTAGIQLSQSTGTPGANISVIIRGQNGIETSTNPLYLIDGVPYGSASLSNNNSAGPTVFGTAGSSPLNAIPPSDIQSIEILKDADATAIYGSRGANGVILITTKKGKAGATRITVDHHSGTSGLQRTINMLGTQDYLDLRRTAITLDGATVKPTDHDLNGNWDQYAQTNWQKTLMGNPSPFHNSSVSISGGEQTSSFLLSGSRNSQGSTLSADKGYTRTGIHLSAGQWTTDKKLEASVSASYGTDQTNWLNSDLYSRALSLQPNAPALKNPDGSLNWASSTWTNPLRFLENSYRASNSSLLASAALSYRPLTGLEAKLALGYSSQGLKDQSATPVSYYDPAEGKTPASSIADYNTSSQGGWSAEPQLSYQRQMGIHSLSLITGATFQRQQRSALLLRGTGFASDALIDNIRAAITLTANANTQGTYSYAGIYARLGYALRERYLVNLTARRDASSRFGPGRRSASFGSIGSAWIFSEEKLVRENLPFLSLGKLRISYGTTGSDQIGDYEYLSTYQSSLGYNGSAGLSPVRLLNPDFGWEVNRKFEVALDAGMFKDRIRLSTGHYRNRSSSQLIDYPLALTTGFSSIRANLDATVQNSGWETELSASILRPGTNKLSWSASLNLTIPRNRLIAFPGLETSSYASRYAIGRPLSIGKLYHLLGVDPATGLYTFQDFSGDGLITALDRQQIVEKVQDLYGGVENSLSYRGIELSFLFQFARQRANNLRNLYSSQPGRSFNQPAIYQGRYWTKPGDIAQMQRPTTGTLTAANTALNSYLLSDAGVSDASFIRLKNVSLSYRPKKLLGGNLKLYLQGQNLLTITHYLGIDPESASLSLPPLRTIVAGLQLNLSVNAKTERP